MAGIYSQGGSAGHRYAGWLSEVGAKNFTFGGKVFNGSPSAIYVGSNLVWTYWLRAAAQQAILAAFGQRDGKAVIKATNAYLNALYATDPTKAQALAGFINQYPYYAGVTGGIYQQVLYINTTGSQYINSEFRIHNNYKITTDCRLDANSACVPWGTTDYSLFFVGSSGACYWAGRAPSGGQAYRSSAYGNFLRITEDKTGIKYGSTQMVTFNSPSADETDSKDFWIGKNNSPKGEGSGYNSSSMSFKNYRIDDENGDAKVFYIAVYRKSDNVIGMIDIVRNRFDINAGSGTFGKGSDIEPTPSTP